MHTTTTSPQPESPSFSHVHHERAFTVLVTGPGHLIGSRAQVAQALGGDGELPPWYAEWHDLLPHWHLDILETPADVSRFFRGAETDVATPRVGFLTNTTMSLSCGATVGAEDWTNSRWAEQHAAHFRDLDDLERDSAGDLRAQQRARQAQRAVDAVADDDDTPAGADAPLPPGVSPRTQRRDALLRSMRPRIRTGLCCPRCGQRALDVKGCEHTATSLKKAGFLSSQARCVRCDEPLGQMARVQDNVRDRDIPTFQSPAWQTYATTASGARIIPWGERPRSNPRYALGLLIGRRYRGCVDLYLSDECHEYKAGDSAVGAAFGALVNASHKTVALTGTLFGGYARDLYHLFLRLGNRPLLQQWGWNNSGQFIRDAGIIEEVTREIERTGDAGHYSGQKKVVKDVRERAGITATLAGIVQNQAVQVLLKHMGFRLVDYHEDLVELEMPAAVAQHYRSLEQGAKAIIMDGGYDALSAYLQATLTYPYQPWREKVVASAKRKTSCRAPALPDQMLPHHEWLARYCAQQVQQGRRVLVYCQHTGTDDILPDIARKITELAANKHTTKLNVAVLRSTTVPAGERRGWFATQEANGVNVVLCNPRLVKTGLNLIGFPSIVVLEPVYSLYDLFQAKRRAFRPTQTKDCEVWYVCYRNTMSQRAISLIAKKAAAAAILSGDDLEGGLMEFDPGQSLLQELAKAVTNGDGDGLHDDIRAMLQQGAQALKADLEHGAQVLIGVDPAASALAPVPVVTVPAAVHTPIQEVQQEATIHDEDSSAPLWKRVLVYANKGKKGNTQNDQPVAEQFALF